MMFLYNTLLHLGLLIGFPLILPLVLTSDKRRETVPHRLGLTRLPGGRPDGRGRCSSPGPVWLHALSVGEVISAAPLVQRLREAHPGRPLVFSASTRTGFEIARRRFQTVADEVCFFPYDLPFSVRRIAGKIDPSLVVIVETDLWPNFLREMKR
ncbi:MAG: 3-deoxy-D-manno-octulosonic acid transferase, partial [Desulfobacterales bacterium]|nr:3-deoxy-D-manno-octulosonic acid transferase [Desulfobacterales bacterium]